jgi:hypothetical protein
MVLVNKAKNLPADFDRPSGPDAEVQSDKARFCFLPVDQLLNRINQTEKLRACT